MGFKLNKFSSRVLKVQDHSRWEGIVTMLFFLLILLGLANLGYKANSGAAVFLFSGAAVAVGIVIIIDFYAMVSNFFAKK